MTPGPRQTIAQGVHPTLGEGRLVYRNELVFFVSNAGAIVEYPRKFVGYHGRTEGGVHSSALVVTDHDGSKFEIDVTGKKESPVHYRIKTKDGRKGWLVVSWPEPRRCHNRFEPDVGEPEEFFMRSSRVWYSWIEMTRTDGKLFVYKVVEDAS